LLIKEMQLLLAEPLPGMKTEPDESSAHYFHVVIAAPKVCFVIKIYHPNVEKLGRTFLLSVQALLSAPNADDSLANDTAEQWKTNETQAIERDRAWNRL
uniref:Uncharacterized protein n=1 Tax=Malurus cyaneus samueli TaxID=2593467 RepID=A0A8C5T2V0_9PASS